MANAFERFKATLERMIFAGLKPDAPMAQKPKKSKIEALMESAEDLASRGLKPEEKPLPGPITLTRKIGTVAGILMIGLCVYFLVTVLRKPAEQGESNAPPPPQVEIIPKGFKVDANKDLEVVEMEFNKSKDPKEITGTLHNLTDRTFARCEISFSVTTKTGAQLGGAATTVTGLKPHGSAQFKVLVPYAEARFAIVRELRTE
jgi:hypothetical protein